MTPEQVAALGPAFAAYLRDFEDCFGQDRTREHLHAYCRGLLSDLPRKSVEPIALAAGTAVRTLQEFLKDHVWDRLALATACTAACPRAWRPCPPTTSARSACLTRPPWSRRQKRPDAKASLRRVGKHENLHRLRSPRRPHRRYKALLDADLFLPQSWSTTGPLPGGRHPRRRDVSAQVAPGLGRSTGDGNGIALTS